MKNTFTKKDFEVSREFSKNLLTNLGLLKNSSLYRKKINCEKLKLKNREGYTIAYDDMIHNGDYHFLLFDESIINLEFLQLEKDFILRYTFLQNPSKISEDPKLLPAYNSESYTLIMCQADERNFPIKIRYDYSEKEYCEKIHSVSHFHVDLMDKLAIPCSSVINPLQFIKFIIKNAYPVVWKEYTKGSNYKKHEGEKKKCPPLDAGFFSKQDASELYLA